MSPLRQWLALLWSTSRQLRLWSTLATGIVLAGAAGPQAAQEGSSTATPSYPTEASVVTVDAVVLDRSGVPIRGLGRDDFTLFADGRAQAIVGFEARDEGVRPGVKEGPGVPTVATNVRSGARHRELTVLIDDLGLTPATAEQIRRVLEQWLRTQARVDDAIMLQTTSGDVSWVATVGAGRPDLLAVVERLRGKRQEASQSEITMSEEEASLIEDASPTGTVIESTEGKVGALADPTALLSSSGSVLDRLAQRYLRSNLCSLCRYQSCRDPMAPCKSAARSAALEINLASRRRVETLLDSIERLARSLRAAPGRKSILVVGERFSRDKNLEARYRSVIDAAQRSNTSVYFTSARGLAGFSGYAVDSRAAAAPGDLAAMSTESNLLAFAGAAHITNATGGAMTGSNDLAAGLQLMATDLSSHYLLGFQAETGAEGRWRELEVRVNRRGATVRARRGYRAGHLAPERVDPKADRKSDLLDVVAASLASGGRDGIPLRMALRVQGPDGAGGARVQIVLEVDGGRMRLENTPTGAKAVFDLALVAVARDRPTILPLGERIEIGLAPKDMADWWAIFREVRLPPGVAQIRATVRDTVGADTGAVAARVEVPDIDRPYVSTLLVTDRTQPSITPGEPPGLVPTALRRFTRGHAIYCQYEVFGFAGRDMPGVAQVLGGYTLRAADGQVLVDARPTLIETDGKRVVRRIALPTESLEPGPYEVLVSVEDRLAQRVLSVSDVFIVEASDREALNGKSEEGR